MKKIIVMIAFLQISFFAYSQDIAREAFYRAVEFKKNGNYKEALEEYDKVLEIRPDFVNALINRANVKSLLNDHEGAIQDLDQAEKLENNEPEVYYNRGNAKHELRMFT